MTITFFTSPWDYFTVTDFLNEEELLYIRKEFDNIASYEEGYKEEGLRLNFPISLNNRKGIWNIVAPKFIELCNKVDSIDEKKEGVVVEASIIKPGFNYVIHNDRFTKTLSFVLHISEDGHGTRLYENAEGTGTQSTMEWIPGGGGGFIRQKHHYHSFDTLEDSSLRYTLLLTKRSIEDKVYQALTFPGKRLLV